MQGKDLENPAPPISLIFSFHAPIAFRLPLQHEDIPKPDPCPRPGEGDRETFSMSYVLRIRGKGGTDMDIRDERYLDYVAMLLISILLLGLTFFEVVVVVLSRSSQG